MALLWRDPRRMRERWPGSQSRVSAACLTVHPLLYSQAIVSFLSCIAREVLLILRRCARFSCPQRSQVIRKLSHLQAKNDNFMKISENLLKILEENGLTQRELAERAGLSKVSLNRWCKGKTRPNPAALEKIATFFGMTVAELCGGGDKQEVIRKLSQDNPSGEDYWRQRAERAEAALREKAQAGSESAPQSAEEYLQQLRRSVRFVVNFIVAEKQPWE